MSLNICLKINQDVLRSCTDKPVAGIEQRLILINKDDLPFENIERNNLLPNSLIDNITLKAGTRGYLVEGIKQIIQFTNSGIVEESSENGSTHSITGIRVFDPSEKIREEINKFLLGNEVYVVVERKWKGENNEHAFLFFGLFHRLQMTEMTEDSSQGTIVFSLSTTAGMKEPFVPHVLRITDYQTTLGAFNNKFENEDGGIFDETFDETFE